MARKASFPAEEYSCAQEEWIGKDYIVTPSLLKVLKNGDRIKEKNILDVGCGNGHYSWSLLNWGAKTVHGIDKSYDMIQMASNSYSHPSLSFEVISSQYMNFYHTFDVAIAIFLFEFSENIHELRSSFTNIYNSLKETGGELISMIPNGTKEYDPVDEEGIKFGASFTFDKTKIRYDGERMICNYFDKKGNVVASAPVTFFFLETYEKELKRAGFKNVQFIEPIVSNYGIQKYGEDFFQSFMNPQKCMLFVATT
uniref:Methyltransf_25 domain-containing protein n=1 Tax=Rhabditophanes sp. KR3021 TaxID=114890 RepID=A0AC35U0C4_9BILA